MVSTRSIVAAFLIVAACCTPKETVLNPEPNADATRTRTLDILNRAEPADLDWANSPARRQLAELADAGAVLEALARDTSLDDTLRFKALEARAAMGGSLGNDAERRDAAQVYASALGATSWHDAWGFPDGSPAGAGARVVALGRPAVPALIEALRNETRLQYEGSEEPTLAAMRKYRVKDLVGTWLAAIIGERFDASPDDPATRDRALEALGVTARAWVD